MDVQQNFLYIPSTGALRVTPRGKKHLGRLFRKYGIGLASIKSISELEQAIQRLPKKYQLWVTNDLAQEKNHTSTLHDRFEFSVITEDTSSFSHLLRELSHQEYKHQ